MNRRNLLILLAMLCFPLTSSAQFQRPTWQNPLEIWTKDVVLGFDAHPGNYYKVPMGSDLNERLNEACMGPENPLMGPLAGDPNKLCLADEVLVCEQLNAYRIKGKDIVIADVREQLGEDGEVQYVARGMCHCECVEINLPRIFR